MAYLTKEQYERREMNAAARTAENCETAMENGMDAKMAEAMAWLCSVRHRIHCNINDLYNEECSGYDEMERLLCGGIQDELEAAGLKNSLNWDGEMASVPSLYCIDDEHGLDPLDDDYEERKDAAMSEDLAELGKFGSKVNAEIEEFMREIDREYGTSFCPTGALRK